MTLVFYFLALFSLSLSSSLVRWAAVPVEAIGWWRLLGVTLIMVPWAVRDPLVRRVLREHRATGRWTLISGVLFFAHLWTFSFAAQQTTIAHCMLLFALNPLFVTAGAYAMFREPIGWRLVASYVCAVLGIMSLFPEAWSGHLFATWNAGDVSAVISGVFFAGYMLTGKKARLELPNKAYVAAVSLVVAVLFGLTGLIRQVDMVPDTSQAWTAIGLLILLPSLLGHALMTWLMRIMNINLMSCGKLAEPVIATFVASLWFHEMPGPEVFHAFFWTAAAVVTLFAFRRDPRAVTAPRID